MLGIIQYMRNKNAARELSEKRRHLACENKVDKSKNALWDTFSLGFRRSSTKLGKIEKRFISLHVNVY